MPATSGRQRLPRARSSDPDRGRRRWRRAAAGLGAAALAAWTWLAPAGAQHPQSPIIRATTTLVDVPVLVLDKQGQPMDMLSQSDFNVYDDGQPQRITGFDNQPRPLSLAIVVDTSDYDAIGQARRSAELITSMVVGAAGEASIFIPGPEPRQLIGFTGNASQLGNILRHLSKTPTAPLGQGSMVEPLNIAMMDLEKQPRQNTRAALVISRSSPKSGAGAEALVENGMNDAIPIFHLSPNHPKNAPNYVNPDSTEQGGTGQGSQRVQPPPAPVNSHGAPTSSAGEANLNLGGVIGAVAGLAGKVLAPHNLDYVYDSGGAYYSASSDNDFDQKLSLIGDELRAIYHLYYSPNNLTPEAALHLISVKLDVPATASVGSTTYRRTYLGLRAPAS